MYDPWSKFCSSLVSVFTWRSYRKSSYIINSFNFNQISTFASVQFLFPRVSDLEKCNKIILLFKRKKSTKSKHGRDTIKKCMSAKKNCLNALHLYYFPCSSLISNCETMHRTLNRRNNLGNTSVVKSYQM